MKARYLFWPAVLATALGSASVWGQNVVPPSGAPLPAGPAAGDPRTAAPVWPAPNGTPVATAPMASGQPITGLLASAWDAACATQGVSQPARFTPFMLGDYISPVVAQFSDVKIAEGESPAPVDRVFFKFNYFNDLTPARWTNPIQPIHNVDLYRYVFGFEKTFFDGQVSIGLRVPFYTLDAEAKQFQTLTGPLGNSITVPGGPGIDETEFGNVSVVFKAVLLRDRESGSLLSAGATISFPTASSTDVNPGQSTLAFIQPFGAFIYNNGDFFVQGFLSVTLPVVSVESIVLFTDLGAGYHVYHADAGSRWLTDVAPTLEIHIADPLRQPNPSLNPFGLFDGLKLTNDVDFTLGATLEFASRATLGIGVVVPVTGPKPFDVEGIVQLNYRF